MTTSSPVTTLRRSHSARWFHRALVPLWKSRERWPVFGSGVGLGVAWIIVLSGYPPGTQNVVTHYSIPFGIDGVGAWWQLWLVPSIATGVTIAALLLFVPFLRPRHPRTPTLLHVTTMLCNMSVAWGLFLLRLQQSPV